MEIAWKNGKPPIEDLYLVAIKLGENSGYYAFSYWDGERWSQSYPENVIAFFPANDLVSQLNLVWPEPEVKFPTDDFSPSELGIENYEEYIPPKE